MSPATGTAPTAAKPRLQTSRAFEVSLAPDPARVSQIRRVTAAVMRCWGVSAGLTDDVVVVVSELVTNAIEHGYGAVKLRVRHTSDELGVEVIDENLSPARLQVATDDDVSGRGLFLVAVLSRLGRQ